MIAHNSKYPISNGCRSNRARYPVCVSREILAEKIRAAYQRDKPRDIWDLDQFAGRPMPEALIRKLVVTKLWQANDVFVPDKWFEKLKQAAKWNWDDLRTACAGHCR